MRALFLSSTLIVALAGGGCISRTASVATEARPLVTCEAPRPEVCTHDYDPVCAVRASPTRSPTRKTYGNDCTACRDEAVRGYRVGSCEEIAERYG